MAALFVGLIGSGAPTSPFGKKAWGEGPPTALESSSAKSVLAEYGAASSVCAAKRQPNIIGKIKCLAAHTGFYSPAAQMLANYGTSCPEAEYPR